MAMPTGEHCRKKNSGAPWARTSNLWIPSLTRSPLSYLGRYVEIWFTCTCLPVTWPYNCSWSLIGHKDFGTKQILREKRRPTGTGFKVSNSGIFLSHRDIWHVWYIHFSNIRSVLRNRWYRVCVTVLDQFNGLYTVYSQCIYIWLFMFTHKKVHGQQKHKIIFLQNLHRR